MFTIGTRNNKNSKYYKYVMFVKKSKIQNLLDIFVDNRWLVPDRIALYMHVRDRTHPARCTKQEQPSTTHTNGSEKRITQVKSTKLGPIQFVYTREIRLLPPGMIFSFLDVRYICI